MGCCSSHEMDAEAKWTADQPCQCSRQYSFTTGLTWELVPEEPITLCFCCCETDDKREAVQDSKKVTGDPEQVARIYQNALQYLLTTVVSYIRNIDMQPMELMAICGIYLWTESPDVSAETNQTIFQVRNEFIVDLHRYYRSTGLTEEDITLRTANLLLLVPKVETLVKMMLEDVSIAEIFNMLTIEETYKGHILV